MMCDAAIALMQVHALKVPTAAKRQYGIRVLVKLWQIPCAILLYRMADEQQKNTFAFMLATRKVSIRLC